MALVNPNIAMSYRGVEVPQQNALADYAAIQQIQSGQRQAEVSQMQIAQMRRDDATLKQIQAKSMENGGPADLDSIAILMSFENVIISSISGSPSEIARPYCKPEQPPPATKKTMNGSTISLSLNAFLISSAAMSVISIFT